MKIKYKYGLLLVDITLTYDGKSTVIKNMVVDTGAARTLISQNVVEDIGLHVGLQDKIVTYFGVMQQRKTLSNLLNKCRQYNLKIILF